MLRVLLVGRAVELRSVVLTALADRGVSTLSATDFDAAARIISDRGADLIITPDQLGEPGQTGGAMRLLTMARSRRIQAVVLTDVHSDGAYGALAVAWDGDVAGVVRAAGSATG